MHAGYTGFGAPRIMGVVETACWSIDAFSHGVAGPRQLAHGEVNARNSIRDTGDDVIHGKGIGEQVEVHQTVVVGQTKAVRCEQWNVREFAELHHLDAPFLKQISLQVMQACPHIQHSVAFVG